jgi:hypothetical protein
MIDMNKYRRKSSFAGVNSSNPDLMIREVMLEQAKLDFQLYQETAPNTYQIYINDSATPILGTLIDVSDLEMTTDSKWLLTSLDNKVQMGDTVTINNIKWLCMYDKEKTTQNCYKVKIQRCNYAIKFPFYLDGIPTIYTANSIVFTFLTDIRDFKQPFPVYSGTVYVTIQYNEITKQLKEEDRIWVHEKPHKITGIDYTNVDYYNGMGTFKLVVKPEIRSSDLDNLELKICDYYKFFPKNEVVTPVTYTLNAISDKSTIGTYEQANISVSGVPTGVIAKFIFENNNINCTITNVTDNSCTLQANQSIGIVVVRCYLESDPSKYALVRIVVKG